MSNRFQAVHVTGTRSWAVHDGLSGDLVAEFQFLERVNDYGELEQFEARPVAEYEAARRNFEAVEEGERAALNLCNAAEAILRQIPDQWAHLDPGCRRERMGDFTVDQAILINRDAASLALAIENFRASRITVVRS
jgi:hypothetical protein